MATRDNGPARDDDPLIEREEEAEAEAASRIRLFDIRRIIGGLFVVYGLLVTGIGIFDSPADVAKAQGVRINLWTGLAMLLLGLFFLAWLWLRPPVGTRDEGRSRRTAAQERPDGPREPG